MSTAPTVAGDAFDLHGRRCVDVHQLIVNDDGNGSVSERIRPGVATERSLELSVTTRLSGEASPTLEQIL